MIRLIPVLRNWYICTNVIESETIFQKNEPSFQTGGRMAQLSYKILRIIIRNRIVGGYHKARHLHRVAQRSGNAGAARIL